MITTDTISEKLTYMDLRAFITDTETNGDFILLRKEDGSEIFLSPMDFKQIDDNILENDIITIMETIDEISGGDGIEVITTNGKYFLQVL